MIVRTELTSKLDTLQ